MAIPELKEAKSILQGIWKHYHYSPKAVRELKELAEGMQVRAYKAVKARWHQMGTPFEANFRCSSFEGLLHDS